MSEKMKNTYPVLNIARHLFILKNYSKFKQILNLIGQSTEEWIKKMWYIYIKWHITQPLKRMK